MLSLYKLNTVVACRQINMNKMMRPPDTSESDFYGKQECIFTRDELDSDENESEDEEDIDEDDSMDEDDVIIVDGEEENFVPNRNSNGRASKRARSNVWTESNVL